MKTNLFLILLLVLSSSCGKKSHSHMKMPSWATKNALQVTQKEQVQITRQEKMVTRYDCHGVVSSHKLETQNALTKTITIDYENRKNAYRFSVHNTKDKAFIRFNQYRFKNGTFKIDFAPNPFNIRVKEGVNEIEYAFERCTEIGKDASGYPSCVGKIEVEKEGIIQIDVIYSSEIIPGEDIIHPSKKSCETTSGVQ